MDEDGGGTISADEFKVFLLCDKQGKGAIDRCFFSTALKKQNLCERAPIGQSASTPRIKIL